MSCTYWDPAHDVAIAECEARWLDDDERAGAWERIARAPAPAGYDPAIAWPDGPASPDFAVLVLTPWRVSAATAAALARGERPAVWRAEPVAAGRRGIGSIDVRLHGRQPQARSRTRRRSSATRRTSQSRFARSALEPRELRHHATSRSRPDFRVPFGHHHADQEEVYVVVAGSARIKLDDEIVELGARGTPCASRPS